MVDRRVVCCLAHVPCWTLNKALILFIEKRKENLQSTTIVGEEVQEVFRYRGNSTRENKKNYYLFSWNPIKF